MSEQGFVSPLSSGFQAEIAVQASLIDTLYLHFVAPIFAVSKRLKEYLQPI